MYPPFSKDMKARIDSRLLEIWACNSGAEDWKRKEQPFTATLGVVVNYYFNPKM